MLGAARPVGPGTERANHSWLRPLFHPGGNRRVTIHPNSNLISITEIHLAIVKVHSGVAKCRTNAILPTVDLLLCVRVSTEHDVVATRLECRAHHGFDLTVSAHNITRCGNGCDLSRLHLELAEPGWKERGMGRTSGPRDAPVLATVRSRDAARNVNAVLGQTIRLGLGTEQPAQENRERSFSEERNVPTCHLEGESVSSRNRGKLPAPQRDNEIRARLEHAQQPDDRGSWLYRPCLVLRESARAATEQFPGFYLGEAESLSDCADFVRLDRRFSLFHLMPSYWCWVYTSDHNGIGCI